MQGYSSLSCAALCALVVGGCGGPGPEDVGTDVPFDAPTAVDTPPTSTCMGTPPACSGRSETECADVMGCAVSSCRGFPISCARLGSMAECSGQMGCVWSGASCTGTALQCAALGDGAECTSQMGCVMGTTRQCGGEPVACASLSPDACLSQPGCAHTPDGGPPDAGPIDAPLPDCVPGGTAFSVRVIDGEGSPLDEAVVLFSGPCAGGFEVTAGPDGVATAMLDPAAGIWSLTATKVGYTAVSVLDVLGFPFDGDVRLTQYSAFGGPDTGAVSGTVTGRTGVVTISGYDMAPTSVVVGDAWSSTYAIRVAPSPLEVVALEVNGEGDAANLGVSSPVARSGTPVVLIDLPSPAATPREHHLRVNGDPEILVPLTQAFARHVYLPERDWAVPGTARVLSSGPGAFDIVVRDFARLPINHVSAIGTAASGYSMLVARSGDSADANVTVGTVEAANLPPTSYRVARGAIVAHGFGYAMLSLPDNGDSYGPWTVFAVLRDDRAELWVPPLPSVQPDAAFLRESPFGARLHAVDVNSGRPWSYGPYGENEAGVYVRVSAPVSSLGL